MDNKIDLDAIIINIVGKDGSPVYPESIKPILIEAIRQTLLLVSENGKLITSDIMHPKGWPYGMVNQQPNVDPSDQYIIIDKQSILDIEKLII